MNFSLVCTQVIRVGQNKLCECIRKFENILNWVNKISKGKDCDLQKVGEQKLFKSSSHKYCF